MSEKDKSQSKEMAELLAENPEAATYIAGVVQGMCRISLPAKSWETSCGRFARQLPPSSHTFLQRTRTKFPLRTFQQQQWTTSTTRMM